MELADYVVIDSPPLTDVSDALPLAGIADEVLIVARLGVTKLSKLARLQDMLSQQGIYASGFVLVGEGAQAPRATTTPRSKSAGRRRLAAETGPPTPRNRSAPDVPDDPVRASGGAEPRPDRLRVPGQLVHRRGRRDPAAPWRGRRARRDVRDRGARRRDARHVPVHDAVVPGGGQRRERSGQLHQGRGPDPVRVLVRLSGDQDPPRVSIAARVLTRRRDSRDRIRGVVGAQPRVGGQQRGPPRLPPSVSCSTSCCSRSCSARSASASTSSGSSARS